MRLAGRARRAAAGALAGSPGQVAGRTLVALVFIHGGAATLNDPLPRAEAAAGFLAGLRRRAPWLPADLTLVRINAATHVVAGALLAAGTWDRQAARILAASLIPTTIAGHPAWAVADPGTRAGEAIQLGKNLGILGGLLLLGCGRADSSGRPLPPE
jgi:putative oxidoreductase